MKKYFFLFISLVGICACSPRTFNLSGVTCDKAEFKAQYKLNKADWDAAFAFMARTDLDTLSVGKYPLTENGCYAKIQELTTSDKGKWERHEKVIDVFYVIRGKDKVGICTLESLKDVVRPYNPDKDVETFKASADPEYVVLEKGQSVFLFPSDGHIPNQSVDGPAPLKLAVVKVPYRK